ncbi:MAG: type II toxin-antitoxin system VapC family toxin [Merismopedia sp. SIO2A8]|nr:type II toxin-antitoxin system VapC family toxin [Merismopedia sp. SIO2A8]
MNKLLFVDTSGWASFFVKTEPTHPQAVQTLASAHHNKQTLITSNYILLELVALLASPLRQPRSRIFQILNTIKTIPYIDILHVTKELDHTAWSLCQARPDKPWSLADCSSFVIMQQMAITTALTTDHHFEQAGYIRLLK